MSPSASRPVSATPRMSSAARSGSRGADAADPSAIVIMTVSPCDTMSCISRAIRARSSAAASRTR
nr:hypothetical protein [Agromyces protaetiae]